jgi:hypothetical protein
MLEEGQTVMVLGQRYLVVYVQYEGPIDKPWVKSLELKGIKND